MTDGGEMWGTLIGGCVPLRKEDTEIPLSWTFIKHINKEKAATITKIVPFQAYNRYLFAYLAIN